MILLWSVRLSVDSPFAKSLASSLSSEEDVTISGNIFSFTLNEAGQKMLVRCGILECDSSNCSQSHRSDGFLNPKQVRTKHGISTTTADGSSRSTSC